MKLFDEENHALTKNDQEEQQATEGKYTEEELNAGIFEDGPTRREIEDWKVKHKSAIYFTPFEDEIFVWRPLEREEYKRLIEQKQLTTMDREEEMTIICTLFPRNLTKESLQKGKAGVPSIISEMIMQKSAFVAQSAPIKL